jgi:hypothetical protein
LVLLTDGPTRRAVGANRLVDRAAGEVVSDSRVAVVRAEEECAVQIAICRAIENLYRRSVRGIAVIDERHDIANVRDVDAVIRILIFNADRAGDRVTFIRRRRAGLADRQPRGV